MCVLRVYVNGIAESGSFFVYDLSDAVYYTPAAKTKVLPYRLRNVNFWGLQRDTLFIYALRALFQGALARLKARRIITRWGIIVRHAMPHFESNTA